MEFGCGKQSSASVYFLTSPLNERILEVQWQKYHEERKAWEESNWNSDTEQQEKDEDLDEVQEPSIATITSHIRKSVRDTLMSTSWIPSWLLVLHHKYS